eukprot:8876620-Pyramimonas_sp.AAC.1
MQLLAGQDPRQGRATMRTLSLGTWGVVPVGRDPFEGCTSIGGETLKPSLYLGPSVELPELHDPFDTMCPPTPSTSDYNQNLLELKCAKRAWF